MRRRTPARSLLRRALLALALAGLAGGAGLALASERNSGNPAEVQPAQAREASGHTYVIPEPDSTNDIYLAQKLAGPRPGSPNASIAYIPNQYLIISTEPRVSFSIRGGRMDDREWTDRVASGFGNWGGYGGQQPSLRYELYQLKNGYGQDGANPNVGGKVLGWMNPRSAGVFPGLDTNPQAATSCSGGPCWREFNIDTGGGNIGPGIRFNPIDRNMRFQSSFYPNLTGYYVFLLKMVSFEDINRGYVTRYRSIVGPNSTSPGIEWGCPLPYQGPAPGGVLIPDLGEFNRLQCPNNIIKAAQRHANSTGELSTVIRNGYSLRARNDFNGAKQTIATAPSNIAAGLVHFQSPQRNWSGLRFRGAGSKHRNDSWAVRKYDISTAAFWSGFGFRLGNVDWDNRDDSGGFDNIEATIQGLDSPVTGTQPVNPRAVSGGWGDSAIDVSKIDLNNPRNGNGFGFTDPNGFFKWQANENTRGQVNITRWDRGNILQVGGPFFTRGRLPTDEGCAASPYTPKAYSAHAYNGRNGVTPAGEGVDSRLAFSFLYACANDNFGGPLPQVRWAVQLFPPNSFVPSHNATGTFTNVPTGQFRTHSPEIQTEGRVDAAKTYQWRACISRISPNAVPSGGADDARWQCTGFTQFRVNHGPTATVADAREQDGDLVHERCSRFEATLRDPENDDVRTRFTVAWSEGGTDHRATSTQTAYADSGTTFNTDQVRVDEYRVGGAVEERPDQTFTEFIRERIPRNVQFNLVVQGNDTFGASDLNNGDRVSLAIAGYPLKTADNSGLAANQPPTGLKHGPPTAVTVRTAPTFDSDASKKELFDNTGKQVTDVVNGQTLRVRTTLTNSGQTPAKFFDIADYFGSTRDFEQPYDITVRRSGGVPKPVPETNVRAVVANEDNWRDDKEGPFGPQSADYRNSAWRIALGSNEGSSVRVNGRDFQICEVAGNPVYCRTSDSDRGDPDFPNGVYHAGAGSGGPPGVTTYRMNGVSGGTHDLTLRYFNGGPAGYELDPPPGYRYRVRIVWPGGSRTVELPIESDERSRELHSFTVRELEIDADDPTVRIEWLNDEYSPGEYDANFGLESVELTGADAEDSLLGPGQLNPNESVIVEYKIKANRNQAVLPGDDSAGNFGRRQPVGDDRGGVTASDTHTQVVFQWDYCDDASREVQNLEQRQGDVRSPTLRAGRGSVHSNQGIAGYDTAVGANATFTVTAGGSIAHFTSDTKAIPNYPTGPSPCRESGGIDWRSQMITNTLRLKEGQHNTIPGGTLPDEAQNLRGPDGNVWESTGSLTVRGDKTFRGVGTIVVNGDLTIDGNLRYADDEESISSLGWIVLGNVNIRPNVRNVVGSFYALDATLTPAADGCPNLVAGRGTISTGDSSLQLKAQGLMVARRFDFGRYFVDPRDDRQDPAEDIYYDGRVVAATPPGFGQFRNTSAWLEVAP